MVDIALRFVGGTLELRGLGKEAAGLPGVKWDAHTACYRAEALAYADLVRSLTRAGIIFTDEARQYPALPGGACVQKEPRPYQSEALVAWRAVRGRGVVVLTTGAGKSQMACMAIDAKRRGTLVVAPTLDLCRQWYDLLCTTFALPVGVIGGGEYSVEPLTVSTYDSA